jgi:2,4-dienoyl-CoA reductase (NADPH2)
MLYPKLFSPFKLRNLTIPNRVVMAPMSSQLGDERGHVTPRQIAYYRARAAGGTGMIIVEFCCVHRATGMSENRQLSLETLVEADSHRALVQAIREQGAIACLQLQHGGPGAKRKYLSDGIPAGPMDIFSRQDPDKRVVRSLSHAEIEHLVECFGRSAKLGVEAGYQAVELHGAHGYLLTCFLSPLTNQRDDAWGGDEERRLHFLRRIIARVRTEIGDRPLIFRLSADEFSKRGLSIEDMERITPKLIAAGVDALHVSIGLGSTSFDKVLEPMSMPEGWRLPYSRRLRAATGAPVITVGQIRWPAVAEQALIDGDADLIALGRPLLADPEWTNKARNGRENELRPCTSCNFCVASGFRDEPISCAENPRTGRELDRALDAGGLRGRNAIVVGAGPGGVTAALMLSEAGFATSLYESRSTIGGGLIASAAPPFKDKLHWYRRYLEQSLAASKVQLNIGRSACAKDCVDAAPAIVVLATGSQARALDIDGMSSPMVHDAYSLLMGDGNALPAPSADSAVVYGGGETGCETAEYLAERGYCVVLITRSRADQLARSAEPIYRSVLLKRLAANTAIRIIEQTRIERVTISGVQLRNADDQSVELSTDCVLIAQGREPNAGLARELASADVHVIAIGDARLGGRIGDAVRDAYLAVRGLVDTSLANEVATKKLPHHETAP